MFGTVKLERNTVKSKFAYNGWGIAFYGEGSWSFHNDFAGNIVIFGVDNSSSSHTDNRKNNFLVLGEGPTSGINNSIGAAEKKFSFNFSKANTKFCLSSHYNDDESYLYVNKTEICKIKANNNISWYNLHLVSVSIDIKKDEQSKISLNGTVYDFSVGHSSMKKEGIFNIHQYFKIKNNIK